MNRESERKRLVELCEDVVLSCKSSLCADCEHNKIDYPHCMSEHFADHLLDDGWTRLPFPIGERVFVVITNMPFVPDDVYECEVRHYSVTKEDARPFVEIKSDLSINGLTFLAYHEDVFTSREDAEKALEGSEN